MSLADNFVRGVVCAKGNHTVTVDSSGAVLYLLHGHTIARWSPEDGTFELRHAGYPTNTTAKALNALLRACTWLPFELKAWRLRDVRSGMSIAFPREGASIRLVRAPSGSAWVFEQMVQDNDGTLAPTIGGK